MSEYMFEEDLEPKIEGRGKLLVAGLCLFLSLLCCALWLVLLIKG